MTNEYTILVMFLYILACWLKKPRLIAIMRIKVYREEVGIMRKTDLITVWRTNRKLDEYIPPHVHIFYELVYYSRGFGVTRVGRKNCEFGSNHFILIPPGTEHEETHHADGKLYCLAFHTNEVIEGCFLRDDDLRVESIIKVIASEAFQQKSEYKEMIEAKLSELIVVINRLRGGGTQQHTAKGFDYVINYLSENFHEKIVLKDFAAKMNFSYDYFQHRFKEIVGVSPQQYLVRKRVELAERLLKEGQLSCVEIADRCGFSNSAQFSAIYKREKGVAPSKVAKQFRTMNRMPK